MSKSICLRMTSSVSHLLQCLDKRALVPSKSTYQKHPPIWLQEPVGEGRTDKDVSEPCLWQLRQITACEWCCSRGGISDKPSALDWPCTGWPVLLSGDIPTISYKFVIRSQRNIWILQVIICVTHVFLNTHLLKSNSRILKGIKCLSYKFYRISRF